MVHLKLSRGEQRFRYNETGAPRTSILGAIAGGVASAAGSSLMNSMFGSSDDVEEAYNPMIEEMQALAQQARGYADQTMGWAQRGWGEIDQTTKDVMQRLQPVAAKQTALAEGIRHYPKWMGKQGAQLGVTGRRMQGYGQEAIDRHRETYRPLEDEAIQDYRDYASGERFATEEARAAADVNQAYEAQRENALRTLEGYGIDPGQARHGALDLNIRLAQAAQQAQAQTEARRNVEATGRRMRSDLMEFGRNYPEWGRGFTETGAAIQEAGGRLAGAGSEAGGNISGIYGDAARTNLARAGVQQDAYRTGATMMGLPATYISAATGAGGTALKGIEAQQSDMADERGRFDELGGRIGQGVEKSVTGWLNKAGGGEIRGPGGPYEDAVPVAASDGEYMIPYEVVHRKGTEFFDKLVEKTRNDMQALPA